MHGPAEVTLERRPEASSFSYIGCPQKIHRQLGSVLPRNSITLLQPALHQALLDADAARGASLFGPRSSPSRSFRICSAPW